MKPVLYVLPFSLALILLIQTMPVRINLFLVRENKDDFIALGVSTFFSLLRFKVEIPVLKQETPLDLALETKIKTRDKLLRSEGENFQFGISVAEVVQQLDWFKNKNTLFTLVLCAGQRWWRN